MRTGVGPHLGWLNGWAIVVADIIVMAALAQIAAKYTFLLFGWDSAANSNGAQIIVAVLWIAADDVDLLARHRAVGAHAGRPAERRGDDARAVRDRRAGQGLRGRPGQLDHAAVLVVQPVRRSAGRALVDGVLLGVFIYWGWDSGVAVNEESEDSQRARAARRWSRRSLLVLIYLVVSTAAQAYGGTRLLADNADDVLSVLGGQVFGSPCDKLLILAVLTSAAASTQTTILPTARTTLSMARKRAMPATLRAASIRAT